MRKIVAFIMVVLFIGVLSGCASHLHTVGSGAQGARDLEKRQWYILWGLVPLNEVDTNEMAAETSDYSIKTELSPLDFIINIFTGVVTITSRTVTVTK